MTEPTHIQMTNGGSTSVLLDSIRPYEEQIRFVIKRMDGMKLWAYCIWRVPEGLETLNPKTWDNGQEEYLQCAGSADALTIELRVLDGDGAAHQFVLGKEAATPTGEPTEEISWSNGEYKVKVYPHEVFSAEEAGDAFCDYYKNGMEMAGPYVVREITL